MTEVKLSSEKKTSSNVSKAETGGMHSTPVVF